jgi:hypothetical protein
MTTAITATTLVIRQMRAFVDCHMGCAPSLDFPPVEEGTCKKGAQSRSKGRQMLD